MPRKKKKEETLVHLDLETLSQREPLKAPVSEEEAAQTTLGDILRTARERKKMTLESVSKKLCIKAVYLNALEKGHYYAFPALAYGIGFLRTYALFLGLNPTEMIEMFHRESAYIKSEPMEMPVVEHKKMMPSWKTALKMGLLFLFVAGGWYVVGQVGSEFETPRLAGEEGAPVLGAEIDTSVVEVKEAESSEMPEGEAVAPATPENVIVPAVAASGKVYGLDVPARLSFLATADVWIEVSHKDGKVLFNKILRKGDRYNAPAESADLQLRMANAGALTLYVDGKEIRPMGRRGAVKSNVSLEINSLLNPTEK